MPSFLFVELLCHDLRNLTRRSIIFPTGEMTLESDEQKAARQRDERFADAAERAWSLSTPRMLHREAPQGPALGLASEQNATLRVGRGEHLSWHV